MGNTVLSAQAPLWDVRTLLQELPQFVYARSLGTAKFMKAVLCKSDEGPVVVKVYIQRSTKKAAKQIDFSLANVKKRLVELGDIFSSLDTHPNIFVYKLAMESQKAPVAFLVRQHVQSNLYDRLSTRPFLTHVEKLWLAYQLLRAVQQCHGEGVCHGDIKAENVLVTSWNWLFLADFASFKPTFLPDHDHADFAYFFESESRRRCYVAPERFCSEPVFDHERVAINRPGDWVGGGGSKAAPGMSPAAAESEGQQLLGVMSAAGGGGGVDAGAAGGDGVMETNLNASSDGVNSDLDRLTSLHATTHSSLRPSMDIFSVGCVIAEMFMDGTPVFDLSALLKYKRGAFDPRDVVKNIADPAVRDLVLHMIQLDPAARGTAHDYLRRAHDTGVFPRHFSSCLMTLVASMLRPEYASPDARVQLVADNYAAILAEVVGIRDPVGEAYFRHLLSEDSRADLGAPRVSTGGLWEWDWPWLPDDVELPPGASSRAHLTPLEFYAPWAPVPLTPTEQRELRGPNNRFLRGLRRSPGKTTADAAARGGAAAATAAAAAQPRCVVPGGSGGGGGGGGDDDALLELLRDTEELLQALDGTSSSGSPRPEPIVGSGASAPAGGAGGGDQGDDGATAPSPAGGGDGEAPAANGNRESLVVVLDVLCACLRHVDWPRCKLMAISLMARLAWLCDDEIRLERLVPYIVSVLNDSVGLVRAHALYALTSIVSQVWKFPPSDSNVFPEYIMPALHKFPSDPEPCVQLAFAACLPKLAVTSRRFLDVVQQTEQERAVTAALQHHRAHPSGVADPSPPHGDAEAKGGDGEHEPNPPGDGSGDGDGGTRATTSAAGASARDVLASLPSTVASGVTVKGSFDEALRELQTDIRDVCHTVFQRWVAQLVDPSRSKASSTATRFGGSGSSSLIVSRLLEGITDLCVFFGRDVTEDFVLPMLFTFLNQDWEVKTVFLKQIIGVSAYVGHESFNEFVMPCVEQSLYHAVEPVVYETLHALAVLVDLRMVQRDTLMHLLKRSVPLLLHPGVCVRRGVEELLFSAARQLGVPDACVIMGPIVRPVLRRPLRVLERPLAAGGATASSEGVVGPTEFARRLRGVTLAPVSRRVLAAEIQKLDRRGSGEPASRGGVGATPADYSSSDSEDEDGDERQFWAGVGNAWDPTTRGAAVTTQPTGTALSAASSARARRVSHKLALLRPFLHAIAGSGRSQQRPRFVRRWRPESFADVEGSIVSDLGAGVLAAAAPRSSASSGGSDASAGAGAGAGAGGGDTARPLPAVLSSSSLRGSRAVYRRRGETLSTLASGFERTEARRDKDVCGACGVPQQAASAAFPFSADEMAALPLRQLSVPDQRFVSLFPAAPPAAAAATAKGAGGRPKSASRRARSLSSPSPSLQLAGLPVDEAMDLPRALAAGPASGGARQPVTAPLPEDRPAHVGAEARMATGHAAMLRAMQRHATACRITSPLPRVPTLAATVSDTSEVGRAAALRDATAVHMAYGLWDAVVEVDPDNERELAQALSSILVALRSQSGDDDDASDSREGNAAVGSGAGAGAGAGSGSGGGAGGGGNGGGAQGGLPGAASAPLPMSLVRGFREALGAARVGVPNSVSWQLAARLTNAVAGLGDDPSSPGMPSAWPRRGRDASFIRLTDTQLRRTARRGAGGAAADGAAATADEVAANRGQAVVLRDHVARLLRLVASLDVPPLPPDLGVLSSPSGDPVCSFMQRAAAGLDVSVNDAFAAMRDDAKRQLADTHVASDDDSDGDGDGDEAGGDGEVPFDLSWQEDSFSGLAAPDIRRSSSARPDSMPRGGDGGMAYRRSRVASVGSAVSPPAPHARGNRAKSHSISVSGSGSGAGGGGGGGGGSHTGAAGLAASIVLPPDMGDGTGYMPQPLPGITAAPRAYGHADTASNLEPTAGSGRNTDGAGGGAPWAWGDRPRGVLLTTLRVHEARINALEVAQDHSFFASASDDGTLRLWPSMYLGRLEVVSTAHTVYKEQGGRLLCLTNIDGTRSIACGSSNGSVHVLKVTAEKRGAPTSRKQELDRMAAAALAGTSTAGDGSGGTAGGSGGDDGGLLAVSLVTELRFDDEGEVVVLRHVNTPHHSMLLCATQRWRIHAVDLRAQREAWCLHLPPEMGVITAMELDPAGASIIVGTCRGFVAVYDLHFQLLVRAWRHSSLAAIMSITPYVVEAVAHTESGARRTVGHLAAALACGENEVSMFNLHTGECLRCLRVLSDVVTIADARRSPILRRVPTRGQKLAGFVGSRPSTATAAASTQAALGSALRELDGSGAFATSDVGPILPPDSSIRTVLCPLPGGSQGGGSSSGAGATVSKGVVLAGTRGLGVPLANDAPERTGVGAGKGLPVWLLTGGGDQCIRCWDLVQPSASHTVCGLRPGQSRQMYESTVGLSCDKSNGPGTRMVNYPVHTDPDGLSCRAIPPSDPPTMILCQKPYDSMIDSPYSYQTPAEQHKGPIPAVASHDDAISCMAWLDQPTRLLVSGGRDGVIKLWK